MELSDLSREELESRLARKSNQELKKLAAGYGVQLPPGVESRVAILDAIFDRLGKPSAAGPEAPSASSTPGDPSSPKPPAPPSGSHLLVLGATGHSQYWCFGFQFTNDWQEVPVSRFTPEQWAALKKNPHVRIRPPRG